MKIYLLRGLKDWYDDADSLLKAFTSKEVAEVTAKHYEHAGTYVFVEVVELKLITSKSAKRALLAEHENAKLKEQLRIAVEALIKIEDANGMWVTSFAEETLKRIEGVGS